MMKKNVSNKKGFTIVELSLASAFLGILLITIALLVTHIITIYQKGMTLKSINMIGEDLIDNFSRSINASTNTDFGFLCGGSGSIEEDGLCTDDSGFKYIYQQRPIKVQIANARKDAPNQITVPASGAFCTGTYSYVWNTGYVLDDSAEIYIKPGGRPGDRSSSLSNERATLTIGSGANRKKIENFHLLRVRDNNREICTSGVSGGRTYQNPVKDYTLSDDGAEYVELLDKSEDNLALYDLTIFHPTYHANTSHAFYSGTFILATIRGGVNIKANGDFCSDPPEQLNTDFAYCAMNKFNFATRATGENLNE